MAERPHVRAMQEVTDPGRARPALGRPGAGRRRIGWRRSRSCSTGRSTPTPRRPRSRRGSTSSDGAGPRCSSPTWPPVGGLREGLSVDEAADMCWILMNPLLQARLRAERGWTRDGGARTGWSGWRPPRCSPDSSLVRDGSRVTGMAETRWEQARAAGAGGGPGRLRRALRPADRRGRRHRGRGPAGRRAGPARRLDPRRGLRDGPGRRVAARPRATTSSGSTSTPRSSSSRAARSPTCRWSRPGSTSSTPEMLSDGGLPDGVRPGRLRRQRDDPAGARHRADGPRACCAALLAPQGGSWSGFALSRRAAAASRAYPAAEFAADCRGGRARGRVAVRVLRPAAVHRRQRLRRARAPASAAAMVSDR